jgi:hypothetical protein
MINLIERYENGVEIWEVDGEFYVYGVLASGDPRVCPSIGMARSVAASV